MPTTTTNPYATAGAYRAPQSFIRTARPPVRTAPQMIRRRGIQRTMRGFTRRPFLFPSITQGMGEFIRRPYLWPSVGMGNLGDGGSWWTPLLNIGAQIGANVANMKIAQSNYNNQIAQQMKLQQGVSYGYPTYAGGNVPTVGGLSPYAPQVLSGISNTTLLLGGLGLAAVVLVVAMK